MRLSTRLDLAMLVSAAPVQACRPKGRLRTVPLFDVHASIVTFETGRFELARREGELQRAYEELAQQRAEYRGRIRWGEVQMNACVCIEECLNLLGAAGTLREGARAQRRPRAAPDARVLGDRGVRRAAADPQPDARCFARRSARACHIAGLRRLNSPTRPAPTRACAPGSDRRRGTARSR